jgi:hypothetical protein
MNRMKGYCPNPSNLSTYSINIISIFKILPGISQENVKTTTGHQSAGQSSPAAAHRSILQAAFSNFSRPFGDDKLFAHGAVPFRELAAQGGNFPLLRLS